MALIGNEVLIVNHNNNPLPTTVDEIAARSYLSEEILESISNALGGGGGAVEAVDVTLNPAVSGESNVQDALETLAAGGGGGGSGFDTVNPETYGAFHDGTTHAISAGDITAHPGWIGTYTAGVTSWDTVAMREAIYAAFAGASTPGSVSWNIFNSTRNKRLIIPDGLYVINDVGLLIVASGVHIEFEARKSTVLRWHGASTVTMLTMNSVSYGSILYPTLECMVPTTVPLWTMDWTGTPGGLKTQQLSIYDPVLFGNNNASKGLAISPSGNTAQGDTIVFHNFYGSGFMDYAASTGGTNALGIHFVGSGDIQGCPKDGISVGIGQVFVDGMSFQNQGLAATHAPATNQLTTFGADVHIYSAPSSCASSIKNIRSESDVGVHCTGDPATVDSYQLAFADQGAWNANYGGYMYGHIIAAGTKGKTFMVVDDGAPREWKFMDLTGVTNPLTDASESWVDDAWIGRQVFYRFTNAFTQRSVISDNDATTLTLATPLSANPSLGRMYKIGGLTGAVAPDWDTAPAGRSVVYQAVGQGFTTRAGDPVIDVGSSIFGTINVNDYIVIIGGDIIDTGLSTVRSWPMPLYAKVTAKTAGSPNTITVDRAPINAGTDRMGYWGGGITDNHLTWLDIDFDAFSGIKDGRGIRMSKGRIRASGDLSAILATRLDWRRPSDSPSGGAAPTFIRWQEHRVVQKKGDLVTSATTVDLSAAMAAGNSARITPAHDITFSTTFVPFSGCQKFKLYITTSGITNRVLTFGTGFKSTGTLSTGTVTGKKYVIEFESDETEWLELSRTGAL